MDAARVLPDEEQRPAAGEGLSEREREILAFERQWWRYAGRQGAGDPRDVRHVGHPLLPGAQRADRPARRRWPSTRCWSSGCAAQRARRQRTRSARRTGPTVTPQRLRDLPPAVDVRPRGQAGASTRRSADPARAGRRGLRRHAGADRGPPGGRPRRSPARVPALTALAGAVGTVAVITGARGGRGCACGGLGGRPRPGRARPLRLAALAGRRADRGAGRPPGDRTARAALPGVLRAAGAPTGTWSRTRGTRWRCTPAHAADPEAALDLPREPLGELAARLGLAAEPGRLVIELRPPGIDKGIALTGLVRERAARSVLFCGDDLGDLPGLRRRRARCGPTACPAGRWAAPAPRSPSSPRRPTWWWTARPGCHGAACRPAGRRDRATEPGAVGPLSPSLQRRRAGRRATAAAAPRRRLAASAARAARRSAAGIDSARCSASRGLADVVRVDQQRVVAPARRPRPPPRDSTSAQPSLGQHRALLGDQVHAVPDRVDQQHVGQPRRPPATAA